MPREKGDKEVRRSTLKQAGAAARGDFRKASVTIAAAARLDEKQQKERALAHLAHKQSMDVSKWLVPTAAESYAESAAATAVAGADADVDPPVAAAGAGSTPAGAAANTDSTGAALTRMLKAEREANNFGIGVTVVGVSASFYSR